MKEQKLTPWFPVSVKPARKGVYETQAEYGNYFSFFDGKGWNGGWANPERALAHSQSHARLGMQGKAWRGLTKEPK